MSARIDYARRVAADWEGAGAPASSEESRERFRERFAALDGPDAEKVAAELHNGVPSPLAYVITWTERALIDAANARRDAAMKERHRLQREKRKRLTVEMKEVREAMELTQREMDGALLGRKIYNVVAKAGFVNNVENPQGSYSMDVVGDALEAYRGLAAVRGIRVGPEAQVEASES